MKATIKGLKSFTGTEGLGFDCNLFLDGKKICQVVNLADGGECNYYFPRHKNPDDPQGENSIEAKILQEWVDAYPKRTHEEMTNLYREVGLGEKYLQEQIAENPEGEKLGVDEIMGVVVEALENERRLRRWCKKATLFNLKGDGPDSYRTVKHPFDETVENWLTKKYGDKIEEIINKRFI